jgi:hypothetical protein
MTVVMAEVMDCPESGPGKINLRKQYPVINEK